MTNSELLGPAHRLSFGCSGLAGLYTPLTDEDAQDLLSAAWDRGLRYFDVAPHYGNGMAEHRLGQFLRTKTDWVVSTKVGRILTPDRHPPNVVNGFRNPLPFKQHFDFTYDGIMRSVEASLNRMGISQIDILYVHDIGDPPAGTDTPEHREALLNSGVRALEELKQDRTVKAVGLGVNTVAICDEFLGRFAMDYILLAGRYTLLDRSAEQVLFQKLRDNDVQLVMGGVFNSGILATGPVPGAHYDYAPASAAILDRTARLEAVCASHNVPLAAAALQFPGRNALVASTLIGTTKVSSLTRNVEQFGMSLPDAIWQDLQQAGQIGAAE